MPGFLHQASPKVREGLALLGYDTLDAMGAAHLELVAGAGKDRIAVPGEKATPEEITAFHHAIGVPKDPKDYVLEVDGVKMDEGMGAFARAIFPEAGVTKVGAEKIVRGWNKLMADTIANHNASQEKLLADGDAAWEKANGAEHAARLDLAMRAASELAGLDAAGVRALKLAIGPEKAMALLHGYGVAAASDGPGPGGGHKTFNITSPDQAKAELDRMKADPNTAAVLRGEKGTQAEQKAVTEKWNRLTDQVAGIKT